MNFGILFSGQGAQKAGMGLDFLSDPIFKETVEQASEASKQDIVSIFKSENDELKKTVYVQPALVCLEAGIYQMLKRDLPKINISGMIGLSLGEYGAVFASGALSLKDTISLVSDRARYMQAAANQVKSSMAALIKPNLDGVKAIINDLRKQGFQVYIANYNSPVQVVIGGEENAVKKARDLIKEKQAAKKAIILRVNGAFHTPLFNSAKEKMHERLKQVKFNNSTCPVISNTTVKAFTNDWSKVLEKQLAVPTHFGEDLQYLINNSDINATLEIGPGKTLTSFAKEVDRSLSNFRISNYEEYQDFVGNYHEN